MLVIRGVDDGLLISGIRFFHLELDPKHDISCEIAQFEEVEDWGNPSPTKMFEIGKRWSISPLDLF